MRGCLHRSEGYGVRLSRRVKIAMQRPTCKTQVSNKVLERSRAERLSPARPYSSRIGKFPPTKSCGGLQFLFDLACATCDCTGRLTTSNFEESSLKHYGRF